MLTRTIAITSCISAIGITGCAGEMGLSTVQSRFEDATATTTETPDGFYTELYRADDGELLATMEIGADGAVWADVDHARQSEIQLTADVAPETAEQANELLHQLHATANQDVSYFAGDVPPGGEQNCHDRWDNCTECHSFTCRSYGCICCETICCSDWAGSHHCSSSCYACGVL